MKEASLVLGILRTLISVVLPVERFVEVTKKTVSTRQFCFVQ